MPDPYPRPVQVLWVYGTSCVGKSSAAWDLYANRDLADCRIAYVDIDQLGMSYPARQEDPERDLVKASALHSMIRSLSRSQVGLLIVSGIMDPKHLPVYEGLDEVEFSFVRLRLEERELAERCRVRWGSPEMVDAIIADARYLETHGLTHPVVDTTGLAVSSVADAVLAASELDPLTPHRVAPEPEQVVPAGQVLLLCGPTPVGKSTVGFQAASVLWQSGVCAAYIDIAQLDFLEPPLTGVERARQRAANLLAVWTAQHAAGATRLVVSGPFETPDDLDACIGALSGCDVTVCRLTADADAVRSRLEFRSLPGGPQLAGDELLGLDADAREARLKRALSESEAWGEWSGGIVIETSDQEAGETLVSVLRSAGWMPST
jgi:hypothetical protein